MAITPPPVRGQEQRKRDVLERLEHDIDLWVATASADGVPCMVPLSFAYVGGALLLCTRRTNPTALNLLHGDGLVTLGLGHTRDVVLIEAVAEAVESGDLGDEEGAAFAARTGGWDPRGEERWLFFRCRPRTVRAWREENELKGRLLMRDGAWLV
ncbi:pyridoxamine 5'-phosphate oxidase [Streptomyces sp. JJ66]|uniref:pyridoxamine 5'-phosphate oxidase family protein n=1 Tax=Streptomyces sp. JJ66 TaxID=2803843 RepID=UPI001C58B62C|nr:pyridoxamine 5'-phosphate oxidase [Streptomyces sp. JJ66]MBW1601053.1 pyridoxamine 5'-phosphate oxidase [Streptomyces sp. JJ66]